VGADDVFGLLLPERDSHPQSERLARQTADRLGISTLHVDLTDTLEALHVYEDQEEILRRLEPSFDATWRFRLVLPGDLRRSTAMNVYTLELFPPSGEPRRHRIDAASLRRLQALNNMKIRLRMVLLYREAESRGALVVGTTNRCETDQGFFVQYGDGGVDLEPIAHLYKTQVRAMARHLGLPARIAERPATPDTWSAPVEDSEFFFRLPYSMVDSLLVREDLGMTEEDIAAELELGVTAVRRMRSELKRRRHLSASMREMPAHLPPTGPPAEVLP
jgi:NAD+ synthase